MIFKNVYQRRAYYVKQASRGTVGGAIKKKLLSGQYGHWVVKMAIFWACLAKLGPKSIFLG